ncbi:uncharacterized protein LOC131247062 [Magnolia sinica]|uniref:uncharacterized protein LOC131247062 n=1 Tax=Magnolia sinica TaxID=86752 RepID=UPI002657ED45|nr:uncharacterized protein LOC131247062 [Magnolia sinica]
MPVALYCNRVAGIVLPNGWKPSSSKDLSDDFHHYLTAQMRPMGSSYGAVPWQEWFLVCYFFGRDLSFNNLTGNVPISLEKLQKLDFMFLTSNKLAGPIPHWILKTNRNVHESLFLLRLSLPANCFYFHSLNLSHIHKFSLPNKFLKLSRLRLSSGSNSWYNSRNSLYLHRSVTYYTFLYMSKVAIVHCVTLANWPPCIKGRQRCPAIPTLSSHDRVLFFFSQ